MNIVSRKPTLLAAAMAATSTLTLLAAGPAGLIYAVSSGQTAARLFTSLAAISYPVNS